VVSVLPKANEGYSILARRLLEHPQQQGQVAAFNGRRPVLQGVAVKMPLKLLKPALRGAALRALYPDDELTEQGWAHTVSDPLESLIQLTEAYTGSTGHFRELARRNALRNPNVLPLGTQIIIPLEWIPDEEGFHPSGLKAPLRLEQQPGGNSYALYVLQPNDTLYSLLIRFTDYERAEEINRLSRALVQLNHLKNAAHVPAGRTLRIPLEWISDDLIVGLPKPQAAQAPVAAAPAAPAVPRAKPTPTPSPLPAAPPAPPATTRNARRPGQPLYVILDPGHGGVDPGAVYGTRRRGDLVYEHEVVYDIALRLMQLLRAQGNTVFPLLRNTWQTAPMATLDPAMLGHDEVLVTPPYHMDSVHVAVNLRIYLVDSILQQLTGREGVDADNVLLISIHGDALAPTLRGTMLYVPDARLRTPEFGPHGRLYRSRREAAAHLIRFVPRENWEAQQDSLAFASLVMQSLAEARVRISNRKPIRTFYYRRGVRTLPGVLRYSRVPRSILVEVGNLNNEEDRRELLQAAARQRIAQGLADAVRRYRQPQPQVARTP
ncbi:MAG TPA: N-acetylmuramoyl-L-alanine amidase, partial [bacterium]|nr:N-acetylmuramoyl-L-alanine amidase [bacterium]